MTRPQLSLPSFKPLRAAFPGAVPLALALAAALVGHGLLLAPNPWRRIPSKAQVLTAEDTTPELLRFSRRMPQEVAATTIPLPPATTLPPPPNDLLGTLPNKDAGSAKTPAAAAVKASGQPTEAKSSDIQPTLLLKPSNASSSGAHGKAKAPSTAMARATGAKSGPMSGSRAKEPGSKSGSKGPKGAQAPGPTAEAAGTTPLALAPSPLRLSPAPPAEAIQRWRDLRKNSEATPPASAASSPGGDQLKTSEAAPYLWLWDQAAPTPFAASTDNNLSEGVQARRLPLAAARALGLDPGKQQWLKTADQFLLVWIDGPNLWLLKGPIPPEKAGP